MSEKHFIGFSENIFSSLNKNKKYYIEVDGYGKVYAEEVVIPLNLLQNYITDSQTELSNVNNRLNSIDLTLPNKIDTSKIVTDINGVSGTIPDSPTIKSYVNSEDNAIKTDLNTLQTYTSGVESRVTTSEHNINTINNDLVSLITRIGTTETNINTTNSNISVLDTRVTSLENKDRIKSYSTANITLGTTSSIIPFTQILVNSGITLTNNEFTVSKSGSYVINLNAYANQSGNPGIWFYLEHKPYGSSTWSIYGNLGTLVHFNGDGVSVFDLDSTMSLESGDSFRISSVISSTGTAILETRTKLIGTTTITQYPVMITAYKI